MEKSKIKFSCYIILATASKEKSKIKFSSYKIGATTPKSKIKFSFSKILATTPKGLFTYYVSQNRGFISNGQLLAEPPSPLVSLRHLFPDAPFVRQFFM